MLCCAGERNGKLFAAVLTSSQQWRVSSTALTVNAWHQAGSTATAADHHTCT